MPEIIDATTVRCLSCGLSKDPNKPDFVHTRLGADEPPEPLICKCKPDSEILIGLQNKYRSVEKYMSAGSKTIGNRIGNVELNTARIGHMSKIPNVEVEMRMTPCVSEKMYKSMNSGVFGYVVRDTIYESGCSWWTGQPMNKIAKLRTRSNGEAVAKIVMYACEIMPGIVIAVSYEFVFMGEILRPEYCTTMNEISIVTQLEGVDVNMIARRYECEDVVSYSSEIEFKAGVTHWNIRKVANTIIMTVGSEDELMPPNRIDKFIEKLHMDESRNADHDVVDVKDLSPYKGTIMLKADGMKVYVFCYMNGYVITFANRNLTVLSYVVSNSGRPLYKIGKTPDILVAELMMDGSLIYIDTIAENGVALPQLRKYKKRPTTLCEIPPLIVRKSWNAVSEVPRNPCSSMNFDGIVSVTEFRTVRLKKPTIDLLYKDGVLHMIENGKLIKVAKGHKKMINHSVYEMTVSRSPNVNEVVLTDPIRRLVKALPNNSDIIKRAFMSVSTGADMDTIMYDITSMSFNMRKRVYELAQTNVSTRRKVIVIFGAGRFQELSEMKTSEYSYIAIDPSIDISNLSRRLKKLRITPYDTNAKFSKQVMTISNSPGKLLYYKGTSESFITSSDVISSMSSMSIPAVFSFSISYHISVIMSLMSSNVTVFGCGFVHDNMPINGVKSGPVSMKLIKDNNGIWIVRSIFGKSTWTEPILLKNTFSNLYWLADSMPDVWSSVDQGSMSIMSRAVIMY
ncbi:hypothetical protein KC359_g8918 [Hortaea werneckii]|nr:hypothetical protein KC359_g8918 [Hortaea werneckii]